MSLNRNTVVPFILVLGVLFLFVKSWGAPVASPVLTADKGKEIVNNQGCTACHGFEKGSPSPIGPHIFGIFGTTVELTDGKKVKVTEDYLIESIKDPTKKVVKGYNPIMPSYKDSLKDDEINHIVDYIKSLK